MIYSELRSGPMTGHLTQAQIIISTLFVLYNFGNSKNVTTGEIMLTIGGFFALL